MIAIDIMHGERAPDAPIQAAAAFASRGEPIVLVGDRRAVDKKLRSRRPRSLKVVDSNSPLEDAAALVASNEATALVSAAPGATVVETGLRAFGRVTGIDCVALAVAFATTKHPVTVVDLGATIDPEPRQLARFGQLGACYARTLRAHSRPPRVGLLVGDPAVDRLAERYRRAHELLAASDLNYAGLIRGTAVFTGDFDVVVTSAFTGRTLVDTIEGLSVAIEGALREVVRGNLLAGAGALMLSRIVKSLGQKLEHPGAGAAVALGLARPCVVAHQRSGERMWAEAVRTARLVASSPLLDDISQLADDS